MSRPTRYAPGGMVFHVLNRGVGRQNLFDKKGDFLAFEGLTPVITFAQSFDAAGRRTQLTADVGGTDDFKTDYVYDNLGRIDTIKQQSQQGGNAVADKYVDLAFDLANQPEEIKRYANLAGTQLVAESAFTLDGVGRLTDLTHVKGQTTFADYDYTFDRASRITAFDFDSQVGNDGDADYTHDDANQLTDADYDADWQTDEDYDYDDNGNRTNGGYTVGDNNRLTSDGTYYYLYDDEGNRTHRFIDDDSSGTITSGDTDITQYTWDHRNRLVKVEEFSTYTKYNTSDPDQVVEYAYDHVNRWVRKILDSDGDGTTDSSIIFVYDGNQITLQFDKTGTGDAAAGDLSHRYLWGTSVDQILADETDDDGGSEDVLWPLTDHLNSVRDLAAYNSGTDTTTVTNHRTYNAFGNITSETTPAVNHLFAFTARPFDEDTSLQNNLNRWYDASVGRWLSEDPIGFNAEDVNLYRYVSNRPTDQTDTLGLAGPTTEVVPPPDWLDGPFEWPGPKPPSPGNAGGNFLAGDLAFRYCGRAFRGCIPGWRDSNTKNNHFTLPKHAGDALLKTNKVQDYMDNAIKAHLNNICSENSGEHPLENSGQVIFDTYILGAILGEGHIECSGTGTTTQVEKEECESCKKYSITLNCTYSDTMDWHGYKQLKNGGYFNEFSNTFTNLMGYGELGLHYFCDQMLHANYEISIPFDKSASGCCD